MAIVSFETESEKGMKGIIGRRLNKYGRLWSSKWIRPYESVWSIWQRYKYVNGLNGKTLYKELNGKRYNNSSFMVSLSIYINTGFKNGDNLINVFDIPDNHFKPIEPLKKYLEKNSKKKERILPIIKEELIYCPCCMEESGYHSYIHQITGVIVCPWHSGKKLVQHPFLKYKLDYEDCFAYGEKNIESIKQPFPDRCRFINYSLELTSPHKNLFLISTDGFNNSFLDLMTSFPNTYIPIFKNDDEIMRVYSEIKRQLINFEREIVKIDWLLNNEYYKLYNYIIFLRLLDLNLVYKSFDMPIEEVKHYLHNGMKPPNRRLDICLALAMECTKSTSYQAAINHHYVHYYYAADYSGSYLQQNFGINILPMNSLIIYESLVNYFEETNTQDTQMKNKKESLAMCFTVKIFTDYYETILSQLINGVKIKNIKYPLYVVAEELDGSYGYFRIFKSENE